MYVATFRFTIQSEKKTDTVKVLKTLCHQTAILPGCNCCRIYSNVEGAERDDEILLLEKWDAKKSMEKHVLSPIFQQLLEIMDFSPTPPELLFHDVAETTGIEMVESLCRNRIKSYYDWCFS